ncbi:MAG: DUF2142 domain-containing protein [Candidatus Dormibacteria bacterium]
MAIVPYAVLQPPFKTPDAAEQFAKAFAILGGHLIGGNLVGHQGGLWVPVSIAKLFDIFNNAGPVTANDFSATSNLHWGTSTVFLSSSHSIIFPFTSSAYAPYGYLPQAAGAELGRLLGASVLVTYYLMCTINAAVSVGLSYLAMRTARIGRPLLFATLCLPTTLLLYFSVSQDAIVIALGVLLYALISRSLASPPATRHDYLREIAFIDLVAVLLISSRFVYVPLLLLPLLIAPPRNEATSEVPGLGDWATSWVGRGWGGRGLALALSAACVPIALAWPLVGFAAHYYGSYYPGASVYHQLHYEVHHPVSAAHAILSTIHHQARAWWVSMLGVLGWLTVRLPDWTYLGLSVALVGLAVLPLAGGYGDPWGRDDASESSTAAVPRRATVGVVTVIALGLSVVLLIESQYLIWTPVGMNQALGVTGRYFIPLLPFVALVASVFTRSTSLVRRLAPLGWVCAAAIGGSVVVVAIVYVGSYWAVGGGV